MKAFALLVSILVASVSIEAQQSAPASTLPGRNIPTAGTDTRGLGAGGFGGGSAAVRSGETAPTDLYGAGLLREEGEGDLASAEAAYRLAIQQFDRQREGAANAIFRLGEVYRKMGRTEEAKVQYARILREFPDMVRLTELSHAQLIGEEGGTRSTGRIAVEQPTGIPVGEDVQRDPAIYYDQLMMERYGIVPGARGQPDGSAEAEPHAQLMRNRYGTPPGQARSTTIAAEDTNRIACANRMKQLALAALIYASDHEGAHPTTVPAMQQEIGASPDALICPSDRERERAASWADFDPAVHMTYEYHGESVLETDADKLLFRCPIHGHAARADGSVMLGPDPSRPVAAGIDSVLLQRYELGARTAEPEVRAVGIVNSIINNLRQIDGAKQQWALEKRRPESAQPTQGEVGDYVRGGFPAPIAGERYEINPVGMPPVAVLTQPIGNRQAGDVIATQVPSETMVHQQSDPIRIHVKEDGGAELDGEPIELEELTERLQSLILDRYPTAAARGSAVFSADDNSPQDRLLAAVDAVLATTAYPHLRMRVRVEAQGAAQSAIQDELDRLTKEIESFPRAIRNTSQRRARVNIEQTFLSKELEDAEARLIPARRRYEASHTSPERLPDLINKDERYQRLKAEYEASVLDKDEEAMKRARERLTRWVEQIYRPELEAERNFAEQTVDFMRMRLEELHQEDEGLQSGEEINRQLQRELQNRRAGLKQMFPSASGAR